MTSHFQSVQGIPEFPSLKVIGRSNQLPDSTSQRAAPVQNLNTSKMQNRSNMQNDQMNEQKRRNQQNDYFAEQPKRIQQQNNDFQNFMEQSTQQKILTTPNKSQMVNQKSSPNFASDLKQTKQIKFADDQQMLENEIYDQKQTIMMLQDEIKNLKKQSFVKKDVDELNFLVENSKNNTDSLQSAIRIKNKQIDELQKQVADLQEQMEMQRKTHDKKYEALLKKYNDLQNNHETQRKELNLNSDLSISKLQRETNLSKVQSQSKDDEVNLWKTKYQDLQKQSQQDLAQVRESLVKFQTQSMMNDTKALTLKFETQIQALEQQSRLLQTTISELENANSMLKTETERLHVVIREISIDRDDWQRRFESLEKTSRQEIDNLIFDHQHNKKLQIEKEVKLLQQRLAEDKSELEVEKNQQVKKALDLDKQLQLLKSQFERNELQLKEMSHEKMEVETNLSQMRMKLSESDSRIQILTNECERYIQLVQEKNGVNIEQENQLQDEIKLSSQLQQQIHQLQANIQRLNFQLEEQIRMVSDLREQSMNKDQTYIQNMNKQKQQLEDQRKNDIQELLNEFQKKIDQDESLNQQKIKNLEDNIFELQENLSMVTRDNEKFANIVKERTSELENKSNLLDKSKKETLELQYNAQKREGELQSQIQLLVFDIESLNNKKNLMEQQFHEDRNKFDRQNSQTQEDLIQKHKSETMMLDDQLNIMRKKNLEIEENIKMAKLEIEKLNLIISQRNQEIESIKQRSEIDKNSSVEQLKKGLTERHEFETKAMEQKILDLINKNEFLNYEKSRAEQATLDNQKACQEWKQKHENLLKETDNEMNSMQQQVMKFSATAQEYQKQDSQKRHELTLKEQQINNIQQQLTKQEMNRLTLETSVRKLESILEDKKNEIDSLKLKLNQLENGQMDEVEVLKNQLENFKRQALEIKEVHLRMKSDKQSLESQVLFSKEELANKNTELEQAYAIINSFKKDQGMSNRQVDESRNEISNLQKVLKNQEAENLLKLEEIEQVRRDFEEKSRQLLSARRQLENMQQELDKKNKEIQQMFFEIQELKENKFHNNTIQFSSKGSKMYQRDQ